jgi:catechol 2,3-dioxygenase-like lactoylglutathione lyase family enzyme
MLFDQLTQKIGAFSGSAWREMTMLLNDSRRRARRNSQQYVNPRFRAYGKARLDIAQRAGSRAEWEDLWKPPRHEFPFRWGAHWKQCIEYRVLDYAAEVGFYIDVLAFPVNAFDAGYAQFTGPEGEFHIAVMPVFPGENPTPPDAIRLQFMVADLSGTVEHLKERGVPFEQEPQPLHPGSRIQIGSFRTPHGLLVELWGEVVARPQRTYQPVERQPYLAQLEE